MSVMTAEFILVYTPLEDDAPSSVRTYSRDEAERVAVRLNGAAEGLGRWTVHELGEAVTT